ncbi:MAG: hypothetical protein J0M17_06085 [Planctomycetes bacterium]|nr:hypothetical protein [Planctomycetota bacterium]
MLYVKLSEKPCLFCSKAGSNLEAKAKGQSFLGVVCPEHLIALLKKWDKKEVGDGTSQRAS